jgi:hypothetical protein
MKNRSRAIRVLQPEVRTVNELSDTELVNECFRRGLITMATL